MSDILAARDLLPAWVVWAPLLSVPALFVISFAAATLGAALTLGPVRAAGEMPWPERARLAHPARGVAGYAAVVGLLAGAAVGLWGPFPLCPVPAGVLTLLLALAGYAGAAIVAFRVERTVRRGRYTLREWLGGVAVAWLMFNGWLLVLLVTAAFMPRSFTPAAWLLLAGGAVAMAFFTLGGGLFVAQALGLVRPAGARLQAIVDRTAAAMGIAVRATHEVDYPAANAFAVIFLRRLAFTPMLLAAFDDDEIAAITAHELGHLTESRGMILARCAPSTFVLILAAAGPIINDLGLEWLMALCLAWLVTALLLGRMIRELEHRADRIAQQVEAGEGTYARALAKIHEINLTPVVEPGKGGTHPHLYDRLTAVGASPDYPRPKPPSRGRSGCGAAAVGTVWMIVVIAGMVMRLSATRRFDRPEAAIHRSLASGWTAGIDLRDLAGRRWQDGDMEGAAVFYGAAAEADRGSAEYPAQQAMMLALLGRREEARRALAEARRRLEAREDRRGEDAVRWAGTVVEGRGKKE